VTETLTLTWPLAVGLVAAVAVSPLSAAWTAALADGQRVGWWRPRAVSAGRWVTVTAVTVALVVLAAAGTPPVAWWLLAVGGGVLAVVDAQTQLLPARLTYPLAGAIDAEPLLRAALAALTVGALWFAVCFLSPRTTGLGDVRLAALTSGVLGWVSWADAWQGQVLALLFAGLTAVAMALTNRRGTRRGLRRLVTVPMGPAMIAGSVLALWL
jgi:leader peptidase (prepilin peptidase)/N-methyltransferase